MVTRYPMIVGTNLKAPVCGSRRSSTFLMLQGSTCNEQSWTWRLSPNLRCAGPISCKGWHARIASAAGAGWPKVLAHLPKAANVCFTRSSVLLIGNVLAYIVEAIALLAFTLYWTTHCIALLPAESYGRSGPDQLQVVCSIMVSTALPSHSRHGLFISPALPLQRVCTSLTF
jgi:hypothetical protein